ncbi:LysM peptidoglycan-binding domain-containing protein [Mycolicibacterium sp.]|uniref:LysM peptidoglycan-binding domain-containing protein n=1 Tax=Mycolicibacterium sp. TaxID=2320850 RepID=UPI001D2491C7|nr:LysM peptidoglycan-binding domain-containing protein [Mycolicibacterium sp.]MCB1263739.1 LysM peptidoglycan-binding domain-containing protein [Mycobacterium sp.]MCB1291647.1 LysM peptidoglycan-binding domain-containing protein [Mycobacterium sp.]MCB9407906.1 LysM peptidoglycan-binding domain-containing protein [Mycolicibacterium sp.]
MGDTLTAGQKLGRGDSLTSNNGAYTLTLQEDGNLVLAVRGEAVWATGTNGQGVDRAEVQKDGNFVLYAGDKPLWHSDTKGKKDVKLVIQDDRNVVLYAADGAAWSSRTETDAPPPPVEVVEVEVAPVANEVPAPEPRTHTVVAGDTLFNIAKQYLGDGNRYMELAAANNIPNPDHIEVGQVITIP